jgi:hypothetical protein
MPGRQAPPNLAIATSRKEFRSQVIQSGAAAWTTAQRRTFANDLIHPQLLAVTDIVNE